MPLVDPSGDVVYLFTNSVTSLNNFSPCGNFTTKYSSRFNSSGNLSLRIDATNPWIFICSYFNNTVKPACSKCLSAVKARLIFKSRITTKLVQSVSPHSLSSRVPLAGRCYLFFYYPFDAMKQAPQLSTIPLGILSTTKSKTTPADFNASSASTNAGSS